MNDLTNQVQQAPLEPVCGVDHLIVSTANPNDYVNDFSSLCRVSTLPHVPNCTVKGPLAMNKYGPVNITVILKDKDGHPVPNQSEHFTVCIKDTNIVDSVKVEENTQDNNYLLSYKPTRRGKHCLLVLWKKDILREIVVQSTTIRNYTDIQKESLIISKYGSNNKYLNLSYLLVNGPNNEIICRDYTPGSVGHLVVFDEQLHYSHIIGEGTCTCPTGIAVSKEGYVYVADFTLCKIFKFKMTGELVCNIGQRGSRNNQFLKPRGLVSSVRITVCL